MFKRFIPYAHAQNVFEIDPNFFVQQKIKVVLVDLDNTLDSFKLFAPSPRVIQLKEQLNGLGIEMAIISNNKGSRVLKYATALEVKYLSSAHKPFKKRILKFLANNKYDINQTVLIGDQLLTDVLCGHHAKLRVILTEPLVKEDQWTTRFNRMIDRPIRRRLIRKNQLKRWVNLHGKL